MSNYDIDILQSLLPVEFENLIKTLLIQMGFDASTTKISGDGGIDIVAFNDQPIISGKYIVQCKRYAPGNNIGEPVIRDLYGAMHAEHANKGLVITTSDFSKQALAFAQNKAIELINGAALIMLLNKYLAGLEGEAAAYVANNQAEKYAAHFDDFQNDCEFQLKRAAYAARSKTEHSASENNYDDKYYKCYAKYESQYRSLEEFTRDCFSGLSYWCEEERQSGQEDFLLRWSSLMEIEDIKICSSLIDDYIVNALSLYKDLSKDPSRYISWLPKLEAMFKMLQAAKQHMTAANPKLVAFIAESMSRCFV